MVGKTRKSPAPPRTLAEVEGFVNLLAAASNDLKINATLERLLAMPDEKCKRGEQL